LNKGAGLTFNARKLALDILLSLDNSGKTLDSVSEDRLSAYPELPKRDKSLVYALVYGVLRQRGHLDWVIARCSKTGSAKIDPDILQILRIGLFQILYLDRIPVSAAVNTAVEMAKKIHPPHVIRFVNAVLRNAVRRLETDGFPDMPDDPLLRLSIEKSFPGWMIERWVTRYGLGETPKMLDFLNTIPPITIRTNTLKTSRSELARNLEADGDSIRCTPYAPDGISLENPKKAVFEFESFRRGWFQVQDEAAQLVTLLLDPQPGETILDACSGLGGKTGHIAQLIKDKGTIFALDQNIHKLDKLRKEMDRLGISSVEIRHMDLNTPVTGDVPRRFDRILLDAPCSGMGVLRRNPDIKWRMQPGRLKMLRENQIRLLNRVAEWVEPGGVMVYAVCSLEPEENEDVVDAFLSMNENFEIVCQPSNLPDGAAMIINSRGFLKTLPHHHHMDGFFAAKIIRLK